MKLLTKPLIAVFALLLFLAPASVSVTSSQNTTESITENIALPSININANISHAQIITTGKCDGGVTTLDSCLSDGIFYVYELLIFHLTNAALVIVGLIFDIILFFSLSSGFYRGGLMESGWSIIRDFTNIVFIFALLVMAFKLVVGQDGGKTKGTLIKTLLVALTINFSLFFTYLVIDASNLLAFTFYNKIEAQGQYTLDDQGQTTASALAQKVAKVTEGQPSISLAIASKINPQGIIQTSEIKKNDLLLKFIVVTSAGMLNILLIYVFGSIALLFLGRSLGLMVSGILAPLAFATLTIPGMENKPYVGFNTWIKEMFSLSFMAPIFVFLMYLVVTFLGNEGVLRGLTGGSGGGVLGEIMTIYIFFMIIGGLMLLAKKVTTTMAGELGGIHNTSYIHTFSSH